MPTITFSIGGPQIDISGKSSEQVLDLVKKEYNKKVEEKKVVEEEEEMKSIDWVKRNEKIIDFTIDRSNEPDTEPESDTDTEEEEAYYCYKCNIVLDDALQWVMDTVGYRCFVCEEKLVDCDFCGVKEDPDEIIKGTEGKACGSCRHLCDKEEEKEEEEDVCCVVCYIKVCGYDEEPPHKDSRDEAVCNDCWDEEEVENYSPCKTKKE